MNKPFGASGILEGFAWKDLKEEISVDGGISIKVNDGALTVEYDDEDDETRAKKIAQVYVDAHSMREKRKTKIVFNQSWRPNAQGGRAISMGFFDTIQATDRAQVQVTHKASISGSASIVTKEMHDSASFTNDTMMVEKALKDPVLAEALSHFNEEALSTERPLYGIYKAIEVITKHLPREREELGRLAGKSKSYVDDVMQTANTKRHPTNAYKSSRKLTDSECLERARILIDAYATSIA